MGRGDKRSFGERLGSTFENGFGDEGADAKVVYGLIMTGLIVLSGGLALVFLPFWVIKRAKRALTRNTTQTPDEQS